MTNQLPIGPEAVRRAQQTLQRYRAGKRNLENRILEAEQWYRLRHWECMRRSQKREVEPVSGWLFNAIANKHASAMDNIPAPAILPREKGDEDVAKLLGAIVPAVLEHNDFEQVYSDMWDAKLRCGTGAYGVFWDSDAHAGLGEVAIRRIDVLSLYWEPGVGDIQNSRNLFYVQLAHKDALLERYPQLSGKLDSAVDLPKYHFDEAVDTSDKVAVVDWYYKKSFHGRTVLHYCKFVGDTVLFATENEPLYRDFGWYDHGLYPFLLDPLFRTEGTPCGFGYIDIGKSAQEYIDRGNQAIMMNLLSNARPRFFLRADGAVNREEYADMSRDFVTADGNLGADSIRPIEGKSLSDVYVRVINNKVDELKEVTGNRDISTGGAMGGVTAASAIAALQEAGSRLDRDANKASYRVFRRLVGMVIALIRQFYTAKRCFRIAGEDGVAFLELAAGSLAGAGEFDVSVAAQKASPYSRLSQNELALQFFSAGFFRPELAGQALLCLDMMDFDRKDFVAQAIRQNALSAGLDALAVDPLALKKALGSPKAEPERLRKAREKVAEMTAP